MTAPPPPASLARPLAAPVLLAVLGGGAVGTLLRVGADAALPAAPGGFAGSTLLVNVAGSFALGLLIAALWSRLPLWARAGLGAGVLGSFTTFSALADSLWQLASSGAVSLALATLAAHLVLGLGAALGGLALGGRIARHAPPPLTDGSDE